MRKRFQADDVRSRLERKQTRRTLHMRESDIMHKHDGNTMSRRGFFGRALATGAVAVGAAQILSSGEAQAQKAPKKSVQYQAEPKGDQNCKNCQFWIPPEGDAEMGGCQIVQGKIHPTGWCNLWAAA
jgi:hypothetical protein